MIVTIVVVVVVVLLPLGLTLAAASVRVLREYERGVVFRLGRLLDQKGPGVVLLVPVVDRMVRVSLRTVTQQIPPQDVITSDRAGPRHRRHLLPSRRSEQIRRRGRTFSPPRRR